MSSFSVMTIIKNTHFKPVNHNIFLIFLFQSCVSAENSLLIKAKKRKKLKLYSCVNKLL